MTAGTQPESVLETYFTILNKKIIEHRKHQSSLHLCFPSSVRPPVHGRNAVIVSFTFILTVWNRKITTVRGKKQPGWEMLDHVRVRNTDAKPDPSIPPIRRVCGPEGRRTVLTS